MMEPLEKIAKDFKIPTDNKSTEVKLYYNNLEGDRLKEYQSFVDTYRKGNSYLNLNPSNQKEILAHRFGQWGVELFDRDQRNREYNRRMPGGYR